jgi:hypothetical protein
MAARQRSGDISLMRALTALAYRSPELVSALVHTSPTEVCEIPSRATGEHD